MQLAICNDVYKDWSWEAVCRDAASAGYSGIEIAPFTLGESVCDVSPRERLRIKEVAAGHGVSVVGLHWLLTTPPGLHLYSPAAQALTQPYLAALADFCADVGGQVLVLGSPEQRNVPPGMAPAEAERLARAALAHWAELCRGRGVTLCLEPLDPETTDFVTTAAEAEALISAIDDPGLALHLDVRAMLSEGIAPAELVQKHGKYLRHVHANDAGMTPPGSGQTRYEPIVAALRDVGYAGYLSVEVLDLLGKEPQAVARESAAFLRRCLEG